MQIARLIDLRQIGQFAVVTDDDQLYEIHAIESHSRHAIAHGGPNDYLGERARLDDHTVTYGELMRLEVRGRTEITGKVKLIYNIGGASHDEITTLKYQVSARSGRY